MTEVKFLLGGRTFADWNRQFLPETQRRQIVISAEESGYSDLRPRPREIGYWDSPSESERSIRADSPALPCKRWRGGECVDGETTLGDRVRDTCLATLPLMVYYAWIPPSSFFGLDHPPVEIPPPRPKTNDIVRVNVVRRRTAPRPAEEKHADGAETAEPEPHAKSAERAE